MAVDVSASELNSEVQVVRLSGRLDMAASEADSPRFFQVVEQRPAGVIVDMEAVDFLSSSGLRMLLAAHQKAQAADTAMALVRVQPSVYKIFKVSALDGLFRFFESEAEAVEAIGQ